jgi:hypothetical protein
MALDNLPGTIFPTIELCDADDEGTNSTASLQTRFSFFDPDGITQTPAVSDRAASPDLLVAQFEFESEA